MGISSGVAKAKRKNCVMTTLVYLSNTCKERVAEVDLSKVASSDLIRTILKEYQKNSYLNAQMPKSYTLKLESI